VKIDFPLQAYFRINAENMGQFERTLIICDEGAEAALRRRLHGPDVFHRKPPFGGGRNYRQARWRCRYTTIQNWANNIYNLVTKRAMAYADATMEWVDGNLGSQLTMKYPAVYMMEPGARGRDSLHRLRRRRPASGRRREAGPLCSQHHRPDHLQVDLQRRRPQQLPRSGPDGAKGRRTRNVTSSATP
jgi:hypothetical protein